MSGSYVLNSLDDQNLPELIQLMNEVGWANVTNRTSQEWVRVAAQFQLFLAIGKMYGHRTNGRLVSCVAMFQYELNLSSLGICLSYHLNISAEVWGEV